jgi:hypothetical protein
MSTGSKSNIAQSLPRLSILGRELPSRGVFAGQIRFAEVDDPHLKSANVKIFGIRHWLDDSEKLKQTHVTSHSFIFMTNTQVEDRIARNKQLIDDRLDTLVDITGTMRGTAVQINDELKTQEAMLKDVDRHMDRTQVEVDKAVQKERSLKLSRSNWIGWILVVVLVIALVVVCII